MLFMTGLTWLLITTYLYPVGYPVYDVYGSGFLIPNLLARIGVLENAVRVVPRLAFGAGLLSKGAAIIGSRVFADWIDWRKLNPPPIYSSPGWHAPGGGWGWDAKLQRLHEGYERASVRGNIRGHRTIDFLAFTLDRSRKRARAKAQHVLHYAQEYVALRAAEAHLRSAAGAGWGWEGPVTYAVGHAHVKPVVEVVHEPAPVLVEHVAPGPAYGPHTYQSTYGPEYIPSSYEAGVSHYTQGPSPSKYYSSPAAAGHASYGGYGSHSSYAPSSVPFVKTPARGVGGRVSSKPKREHREQESLTKDEFESLMAWAGGKAMDYNSEKPSGPRTVRIKRQHAKPTSTPKVKIPAAASDGSLLPNLIDDVGRFFTVIEFLDENKCLQKFVCNVHSRAKALLPERMVRGGEDMSPFESSVVAAFKVLDTFMPTDDASYKGYREAALVGAKATNETVCMSQYSSCSYTAAEIVRMNDTLESAVVAEEKKAKESKEVPDTPTRSTEKKPAVKKRPKSNKNTASAA